MKIKSIINKHIGVALAFVLPFCLSTACTDDPNEGELFVKPATSKADMSIADVLSKDTAQYSLWVDMMKYANYYNALKDAKSTATVFCPNNKAMAAFLRSRGVASVRELDQTFAREVVSVHIIKDARYQLSEVDTAAVKGETLGQQTLFGTYLTMSYGHTITDVDDAERTGEVLVQDSIFINNEAELAQYSVDTCSNGYLYSLNNVITPLTENVRQKLELYGDYSIFTSAIATDRQADSICTLVRDTTIASDGSRVVTKHSITCLAVPDEVYKRQGITDVGSLKNWLVTHSDGEETDPDSALSHYLLYHLMPIAYNKNNIFSFQTEGETRIYDTFYSGQAFIADNESGDCVINKEIHVLRSDLAAANGVIHKIDNVMPVYHPEPVNVMWDFLNSSDVITAVNAWGAARGDGDVFSNALASSEKKFDLSNEYRSGNYGKMTSFTYEMGETSTNLNSYNAVGFVKEKYLSATRRDETPHGAYMNNYLVLNLGYPGSITFTTPTIVAGHYRVVLHYIKNSQSQQNLFTSGTMTRFTLDEKRTFSYLYKGLSRTPLYESVSTTLWGDVEFETSTTHKLNITLMDIQAKTLKGYHLRLDYVEFIPLGK